MSLHYRVPDGINPKQPAILLASWFGCGFMNPAPGTWGSLGALPIGIALYVLGGPILLLVGISAVIPLGLWAAREYGKAANEHDSKQIVIDEVAGMWIALLPAAHSFWLVILAFLLFRLFDILKPWPVSYFDKHMKNTAGVMMDDIVAALLTCLVLVGISAIL